MIAAVIVTYNRKNLLCDNIESLLGQSLRADKIFVIDNCSTDGTYELLVEKGWIDNRYIQYVRCESNIGGAGGFCLGTQIAYNHGADWIVLMDDDGKMANAETMMSLYTTAQHLYKKNTNGRKLFINALVCKGEYLSFKMSDMYTVRQAMEHATHDIIPHEANPFNGTLISRELVDEIGYPNKDFFIKGDEVDYKMRARDAGAYIATVVNARYYHPRPEMIEKKILGMNVPIYVESPWKEYYTARNFTYLYKKKGYYKAICFELIFVKFIAIFILKCKKIETIRMVIRGIKDGWKGKLGPVVLP